MKENPILSVSWRRSSAPYLLLCLAIAAPAPGDTLSFTAQGPQVVEDTRLAQINGLDAGNFANGDLITYDSGLPNEELQSSLIWFDLSDTPIPGGGRITRAQLSVYLFDVTPDDSLDPGQSLVLQLGRMTANWDETAASRDNRLPGVTWNNSGPATYPFGDHYNNGELAEIVIPNPPNATIPLGWHTFDSDTVGGVLLLEVIQDVFDNPDDNHGFVLWHPRPGRNRRLHFYSSETGLNVGGQNLGPKLQLEFIPIPAPATLPMVVAGVVALRISRRRSGGV